MTDTSARPSRPLNITLWVVQILLALLFCGAGFLKLTTPIAQLSTMMPWTGAVSPSFVRVMALVDLAGGLGVLLPALTRIQPRLAVFAALGCVALQICAAIFHMTRGELGMLPINAVLLALSAFVWWGRGTKVPIAPRR